MSKKTSVPNPIKILAGQLEDAITSRLLAFGQLAEESAAKQKDMAKLVKELEPVEFLIKHQYPHLSALFEQLKLEYQGQL